MTDAIVDTYAWASRLYRLRKADLEAGLVPSGDGGGGVPETDAARRDVLDTLHEARMRRLREIHRRAAGDLVGDDEARALIRDLAFESVLVALDAFCRAHHPPFMLAPAAWSVLWTAKVQQRALREDMDDVDRRRTRGRGRATLTGLLRGDDANPLAAMAMAERAVREAEEAYTQDVRDHFTALGASTDRAPANATPTIRTYDDPADEREAARIVEKLAWLGEADAAAVEAWLNDDEDLPD